MDDVGWDDSLLTGDVLLDQQQPGDRRRGTAGPDQKGLGDSEVAYDVELDSRVSEIASGWGATRKAMFGGTGYMLAGNLFAGVYKERLLVRLSAEEGASALGEPDVAPFDMMPRPMPGWVTVGADGLAGDGLMRWLERGRAYAESLPPK